MQNKSVTNYKQFKNTPQHKFPKFDRYHNTATYV